LGGGPAGSFRSRPMKSGAPEYFFVVGLTHGTKPTDILGGKTIGSAKDKGRDVPVVTALHDAKVLDWLRNRIGYGTPHVTIGGLEQDQPRLLRPWLAREFRVRTFKGSSVAAATAVFCSRLGIDAFLGVVSRPQVTLIATAARALDAYMCAFRVNPRKRTRTHLEVTVTPGTKVLGVNDFVADKDVFLIMTGITENLVVKGVRFRRADLAETHTLVLRSYTGSSRYVSNHHDLKKKQFMLDEECRDSQRIWDEMLEYIDQRNNAKKRRSGKKARAPL
jgi:hypothetical protein